MKILTHFAHGVYQSDLAKIGDIKFYHVIDSEGKLFREGERPTKFWSQDTQPPPNIIPIESDQVNPPEFDLILVHWHPFIDQFAELFPGLPIIFLEHTWPYKNLKSEVFRWREIRHKYCKHTVFITPSSQEAWGVSTDPQASYIYHSFDPDEFPQKTDYTSKKIMTTTNEFISRDWACGFSLWSQVLGVPGTSYFEDIALYGYGNKNIGKVSKGVRTREEILDLLVNAGAYFNPSIMSPIPMSLLEAIAVGTPIVSTAYCEPGTIFKDRVHGVITNDPIELRDGIKYILDHPEDAQQMAIEAKKVVKTLFAPIRFRTEWRNIFARVAQ